VFAGVMLLLLRAVFLPPRTVRPRLWLIGGGIALPAVVLAALLTYSLAVGNALAGARHADPFLFLLQCISSGTSGRALIPQDVARVQVIGRRWWWEVRYEMSGGREPIVLANELHLPAGKPFEILLTSADVIHSFWVPAIAGKVDMIPGHVNRLVVRVDERGTYRGQCAEYCGGQHAMMALHVVVEEAREYGAWLTRQSRPAQVPDEPTLRRGYEAFITGGCDECHAVRGTPARGRLGPDLTHVGSRRALAAGVLDNHVGAMAGWIANPQRLKPGNLMPATARYSGPELRALAAWLGSLD
jgi:cytochrome c oxidase subunit 2